MAKWISVSIYYDDLNKILVDSILPIKAYLEKEKLISGFIFNRSWERGENLLVKVKIDNIDSEALVREYFDIKLKEYFKDFPAGEKKIIFPINDWFLPLPNNHILYNDNFLFDIMETGGLQASEVAENLLAGSSGIILPFIEASEGEWGVDHAFGPSIQIHLGLTIFFGMNIKELKEFYQYFFDSIMDMTHGVDDGLVSFKTKLTSELQENFDSQKENLVAYIDYIQNTVREQEAFDEDWMNTWLANSAEAYKQLQSIQEKGKYVTPEGFEANSEIGISSISQELWPVLVYYLRYINTQMGLSGADELNLIFSIKSSVESIAIENQVK